MKKIIYAIVLSTFIYTSGYYVWVGSSPIQFKDESYQSGVASEGVNSSGPTFIDYDNDGDIDIYVVTEYHGEGQGNRLFENYIRNRGLSGVMDISRASWTATPGAMATS